MLHHQPLEPKLPRSGFEKLRRKQVSHTKINIENFSGATTRRRGRALTAAAAKKKLTFHSSDRSATDRSQLIV